MSYVISRKPPKGYRLSTHGPRGHEGVTYSTEAQAAVAAQKLADRLRIPVGVFDASDFPRAKSIRGNRYPGDRLVIEQELDRAPANERRTAKVKRSNAAKPRRSSMPSSKLMGLASFRRNPLSRGYWFTDPGHGGTVTSSDLRSLYKTAVKRANETGKAIRLYWDDVTTRGGVRKGTARPRVMRKNPTSDYRYSVYLVERNKKDFHVASYDNKDDANIRAHYERSLLDEHGPTVIVRREFNK